MALVLGAHFFMPPRDSAGFAVKFAVPTVADGHVFVGVENQVSVYGLLH